jgi:hypothetical protein
MARLRSCPRARRRGALAVALVGVAALPALGGCSSAGTSSTTSSGSMRSRKTVGAPGAKVRFVTPKEASTQPATVVARVKLIHFKLAPKQVGKAAKQGEGHLHFSLDRGQFDRPKYSGPNGKEAVKLGVEGKYSPSVKPTIVYTNLPTGTHELEVYLANNDHTNTGVYSFVSFIVKAGGAAPSVPKGSGSGY